MPPFDLTGLTTRPVPGSNYADTLRQFFGIPGSPDDPIGGGGANTAVAGSALRNARAGELQDQATADPHNPVLAGRLKSMESDEALDPYSDTNITKRAQAGQSAADTIARFMDPAAVKQRAQVAREAGQTKLQEAEGTALGQQQAALTPDADVLRQKQYEQQRRIEHIGKPLPGTGDLDSTGTSQIGAVDPTTGDINLPPNAMKGDQKGQDALRAIQSVGPLIGTLEQTLNNPGAKNGNALSDQIAYGMYKMGLSPDTIQAIPGVSENATRRIQLAGLIRAVGSSPFASGTRSFQYMKLAMEHLTDPGASDDALRERIQGLKAMYPAMQREIIQAHINPGKAINFSPIPGM